jgi:hypothetical protein
MQSLEDVERDKLENGRDVAVMSIIKQHINIEGGLLS